MGDLFSDHGFDTGSYGCEGGWTFPYYKYLAYYTLLKFGGIREDNKGWLVRMAIDPTPYHHIRNSNTYCAKHFVANGIYAAIETLQNNLRAVKEEMEKEGKSPPPIESCISIKEGEDIIPDVELEPLIYNEYKNNELMRSKVNWWCKSFILLHAHSLYEYFKKDSLDVFTGNSYKMVTLDIISRCCPFSDLENIVENERRKLDELKRRAAYNFLDNV